MSIDLGQASQLISGINRLDTSNTSAISDLVTGDAQPISTAIETSLLNVQESNLTDSQQASLAALTTFVQDNIAGAEAERLLSSIAALQNLLEFGNETEAAALDPVLSLLSANPDIVDATNGAGQIVDQLL